MNTINEHIEREAKELSAELWKGHEGMLFGTNYGCDGRSEECCGCCGGDELDIMNMVEYHKAALTRIALIAKEEREKGMVEELHLFLDGYLLKVGASKDSPLMVDLRAKLSSLLTPTTSKTDEK